jgi:DNA-binding transcriptional MerR regulator
MGLANTNPMVRMNATFAPVDPIPGNVAFMTQSGALGISLIDESARRGIGISSFVSVGNKADISGNDLLRYWETEFKSVRPQKTRSQQRLYRKRDVELLLKIRHLLYEKRFTIEGARQTLHSEAKAPKPERVQKRVQTQLFGEDPLPEIRKELQEILLLLK